MVKVPPVACSKDEIDRLLDACIDNDFYYTLFFIAKTTGRRLGEYYGTPKHGGYSGGVKISDIDFEKKVMMTQVLKKRNLEYREALLTDEACRLLKQFINKRGLKDKDYLFRQKSYRQIQEMVVQYSKRAGIKHKVSFHNFRHYFITEMIRRGLSHNQIAKLTGHGNIGTIASYDHTIASDVRDIAIEKIKEL